MNYVCENYEVNKEKAKDNNALLAAYAKKLATDKEKEEEKNA